MNKQQLAAKIWESANKMRSKIEPSEYKDYILSMIFYRFCSSREEQFLRENDFDENSIKLLTEEDEETVSYIQENCGYFISYENLFSTWIAMGKDFDISNVRDALSAFSRLIKNSHRRVYEGIFDTLQTGLSKLGDSSGAQTKAIRDLIHLIKDIPMDGTQDYDVLGFIYEYLIGMFAANAGKKAGEFYTPNSVSILKSEIIAFHLKDRKEISIYDSCSGSGSLLINIGKSVSKYVDNKNNIKYYAQELKESTYNLTRMNLIMRGILPDNIVTRNGDTLEDDWPYFDENDPTNTYNPLYVDAIASNPPYSQNYDPTGKENDPRYARYGLAPQGKADYAFLLHDLYHLKPDGIMTIILPHGVLFRGGEEGTIRKNLIENNNIDAIIGLPANIFYGTGIPTVIIVLKQKRENKDVLIIDASKNYSKEGKNNILRSSDIKRIIDTVKERKTTDKFSRVVSLEEIRKNDYNLNIPRYVDSSEEAESWDIYASMFGGIPVKELNKLQEYWDALPELKESLFTESNTPYVQVAVEDMKAAIMEHPDVIHFKQNFHNQFDSFRDYLKKELIERMVEVSISKEEEIISENLFGRMEKIPLLDKYEAYQILDDEWKNITADLEMIQSEGFEATRQVDPNMIMKKKEGKDQEVQEGWKGHIITFELMEKTLLKKEYDSLHSLETSLAEIPAEYEEILESLTEEEKETDVVNETGDAFVAKEVTKKIKELRGEKDEDAKGFLTKLVKVEKLMKDEKELKIMIKKEAAALHNLTKERIEALTDEEVYMLLEKKWIDALIHNLNVLPEKTVDILVSRLQILKDKYATTYKDIQEEIKETEKSLCSMMDELTGSEYDVKGLSEFKSLLMGD